MYSGGYIILDNNVLIENIMSTDGHAVWEMEGIYNTFDSIYNSNKPCIISGTLNNFDAPNNSINVFFIVNSILRNCVNDAIMYHIGANGLFDVTITVVSEEPNRLKIYAGE